jgi:predicted CXXCH cytochrome family protein
MRALKSLLVAAGLAAVVLFVAAVLVLWRGFRATTEPSRFETVVAGLARNWSIPRSAGRQKNPLDATSENLRQGRDLFLARCTNCHGHDGTGVTPVGRHLYPRAPDLSSARTQGLTDGQMRYIIDNGVQLTGMPAWDEPQDVAGDASWKLVLFIRSLRPLTQQEASQQTAAAASARYLGSPACAKCHPDVYARWAKTPMANVLRDPREHPDAILPDLATNTVAPFTKDQIAFVYGSLWKQRFFTKVGDDYFPLSAQWEVKNHVWSRYMVPNTGDWWASVYPPDNLKRPTGATCDGCHSVDYNIHTKTVAEWNVGCERCHGPGSAHVADPSRGNILNPAHMNYVEASDACIQCHSQGRPLTNPIEGRYYDWPVGYHVGLRLQDFWQLEDHAPGQADFYFFADGTAHKNRMQGNDFVQSVMYRRGITCATCHDVHGTTNYAQLRKPADRVCMDCHAPLSPNGPRTATLEAHTHHKDGSAGSQCVACHMPAIETEGVPGTYVHAHTFRFITPAMTDKYKVPNPCTSCHTDKSTAWAEGEMRGWAERSPWRLGH